MEEEDQMQRSRPEIEYNIEYLSERNVICIWLVPSHLVVSIESSDFLMFQANMLTFEKANVNIELGEIAPCEGQPALKRVLTFKGTSCFNNKEPPLEKILSLMDVILISYLLYEPEFSGQRMMQVGHRDYERVELLQRKIHHYIKIFLKCSKRVYNE